MLGVIGMAAVRGHPRRSRVAAAGVESADYTIVPAPGLQPAHLTGLALIFLLARAFSSG